MICQNMHDAWYYVKVEYAVVEVTLTLHLIIAKVENKKWHSTAIQQYCTYAAFKAWKGCSFLSNSNDHIIMTKIKRGLHWSLQKNSMLNWKDP